MVQLSEHLEQFGKADDLVAGIRVLKGYDQDDLADLERVAAKIACSVHAKQNEAMFGILADLQMDAATLIAGMALFAVQENELEATDISNVDARKLVNALLRLASAERTVISAEPMLNRKTAEQAANARNLLIGLIDDPRVAVIKLVEQVTVLSEVFHPEGAATSRVVRDVIDFYSPLAGRLGVFKLKWLLEDLAFRCLRRTEYDEIAARLAATRHERELQVEAVCEELRWRLEQANIKSSVRGRAKHIYGIWRKMRDKHLKFNEIRDIDALRVIVESVEECYAALGVIHTSWPHIPEAFDDYIANPKHNGYQSIHTAVVGPRGKTIEVQIRTLGMHEAAELGICSHWAYKGIDDQAIQSKKVDWLRHVIEWQEELQHAKMDADLFLKESAPDRVYVTTPQGHIVDLAQGATALDFAYRIHTEVGNTCSLALADGHRIPLNQPLANGMVVEIQTNAKAAPKREWLNPELGFVQSSRAREKIQSWFKEQEASANISAGRELLEETLQRVGLQVKNKALVALSKWESEKELLHAIGVGDQLVSELMHRLVRQPVETASYTVFPVPTDARDIKTYKITVEAADRPRLLVEIATVIADADVNLISTNARAMESQKSASITAELEAEDLVTLSMIIDRLRSISGVEDVRRVNQ